MAKSGINKVILIGNLGQDPEVRYMPNGTAVANIRIATSESWRDKISGEQRELTEWHRIVCFRNLAEIASEYLRKGAKIYIEGRLRTNKWQDQNGQERYTTEIHVDTLQMLDSRSAANTSNTENVVKKMTSLPQSKQENMQKKPNVEDTPIEDDALIDFDDSIPF